MLSHRLRMLREELGLTQKELANKFEMSDARYNQYETGKRNPDYETLSLLADFFKVSVDFLLGRTDIKNPYEIKTIAAHYEGDEFTEEELEEIEKFKEFVKMKKMNKEKE